MTPCHDEIKTEALWSRNGISLCTPERDGVRHSVGDVNFSKDHFGRSFANFLRVHDFLLPNCLPMGWALRSCGAAQTDCEVSPWSGRQNVMFGLESKGACYGDCFPDAIFRAIFF